MLDINEIKRAAENGILEFYIEEGQIFCEHNITHEKICIGDGNKKKISHPFAIISLESSKTGNKVYYKLIHTNTPGRFPGEIEVVEDIKDATKFYGKIGDTYWLAKNQIQCIQFSLWKNTDLSNPQIEVIEN